MSALDTEQPESGRRAQCGAMGSGRVCVAWRGAGSRGRKKDRALRRGTATDALAHMCRARFAPHATPTMPHRG